MKALRASLILFVATAAALRVPRFYRDGLVARQDGTVPDDTSKWCTYYHTTESRLDTCTYIENYWGITHQEFVAWNPSVKDDCSGIKVGYSYCVEVNHGDPIPSTTNGGPSATSTPIPSPTLDGTIKDCNGWYFAVKGDLCDTITKKFGLTTKEFIEWNPAVGADCSGLWASYYYCVSIPGHESATKTTSVPTGTATPAPSPTLDGTVKNCNGWHYAVKGDLCDNIAKKYGITTKEFVEWNPAVGDDCSGLWASYYYCVSIPGHVSATTTTMPTPTGTPAPSPTLDGTVNNCNGWHFAIKGDLCDSIAKKYGITTKEFVQWNPAVGDDCSGLWASYYYCVSIPGHVPATTTTQATPTGPTPPAQTQPGIVADCQTWYVTNSGDGCDKVIAKYGNLDMATFVKWNPAVKNDCSGLWVGYAYCVGTKDKPAKPPTPTTSQTPTPTGCTKPHPTPTQPGSLCECNKWHAVASDDSCYTLTQKYKITEAQIKKWNPGLVNCGLWLGYNVCVGA